MSLMTRLRRSGNRYGWSGDYGSFAEAQAEAEVIDSNDYVVDVVRKAKVDGRHTLATPTGPGLEPGGAVAALATALTHRAPGERVRILDFGGALGSHYFDAKRLYRDAFGFEWVVSETNTMADAGNEHFANEELRFVADWREAKDLEPSVVLVRGALQYIEDPIETLRGLLSYGPGHIVLDVLPLIPGERDRLTIQRLRSRPGAYPCWFFSERLWLEILEEEYAVRLRWELRGNHEKLDGTKVRFQGLLLQKK